MTTTTKNAAKNLAREIAGTRQYSIAWFTGPRYIRPTMGVTIHRQGQSPEVNVGYRLSDAGVWVKI